MNMSAIIHRNDAILNRNTLTSKGDNSLHDVLIFVC